MLAATATGKPTIKATPPAACTAACTSEARNANAGALDTAQGCKGEGTDQADPLAALAAAIAALSPAERERLAAMLAGHPGKSERKGP